MQIISKIFKGFLFLCMFLATLEGMFEIEFQLLLKNSQATWLTYSSYFLSFAILSFMAYRNLRRTKKVIKVKIFIALLIVLVASSIYLFGTTYYFLLYPNRYMSIGENIVNSLIVFAGAVLIFDGYIDKILKREESNSI